MKKIVFITVITCISLIAFSGSITVGPVTYNAPVNWSGTDTVIVSGIITIGNNGTLTISPGTVIFFTNDNFYLNITGTGRLLAVGTETDSILFTPQDKENKSWRGIRFSNMNAATDSSVIDHCIIEYSAADDQMGFSLGGGIYIYGGYSVNFSKVRISNSTFRYNYAYNSGGAICCEGSSPVISNCTFSYNTVSNGVGGAIHGIISSAEISNCKFLYNTCSELGGAILFENNSNPKIIHSEFKNNASRIGGAISCVYYSSPTITNNIISNNSATEIGGAISCDNYSNLTLLNNNITGNTAGMHGGAINCSYYTDAIISGNTISNNSANDFGGALHFEMNVYPTLQNNVIINNSSSYYGGAISCINNISSVLTNNTICNNFSNQGGAIYFWNNSNAVIKNTIFYGNIAPSGGHQVFLESDDCDPGFYNCDIQGDITGIGVGYEAVYTGTYSNNMDSDPLFVLPSNGAGTGYDGVNADWHIQIGSPCINAGDTSKIGLPVFDKDGNPRIMNLRVDIGAFETYIPCTNPTDAGSIGEHQNLCPGDSPARLNNLTLPSGHTGNLEYKWQQSTFGAGSGFTDIPGTNNATYQPIIVSDTTWFKRIARGDCMSDWAGAAESNVVLIKVNPIFTFNENQGICSGEVLSWHGNNYTATGTYYDSLVSKYGCDSVFLLNLTVHQAYESMEAAEICSGNSYSWHGNDYMVAGIYYDSLLSNYGCDSVFVLNLSVHPAYESTVEAGICPGNSYSWRGQDYTAEGLYYDSLTSQYGCDSVYILSLTVHLAYESMVSAEICAGDSYLWHGNNYTAAGIYYDTLTSVYGCDSIYTLDLTVNVVDVSLSVSDHTISANLSDAVYQWLDCNHGFIPVSGEVNQSFTASSNGNYAVQITQGECTDTSVCEQIAFLGIADNAIDEITIYPNPFSNEITIRMEGSAEKSNVEIIDVIGQLVYKGSFSKMISVETSDFSPGIYIIQLENGNLVQFIKIIKE